jgi:hypothetical protein
MRRFPDPKELVAAYWEKLTSSIERDGTPARSKAQALNGRLRSRSRFGMRQRPAALRAGKRLPGMRGPVRHPARLHSHS